MSTLTEQSEARREPMGAVGPVPAPLQNRRACLAKEAPLVTITTPALTQSSRDNFQATCV
jgi:hypothetical protein